MRTSRLLVAITPALAALLASGCAGDWNDSGDAQRVERAQQASEIPSTVSDTARLGQAYDSQRQKLMFRSCVTGPTYSSGNTRTTLELRKDMSFDDIMDAYSGSLNVGVSFPVVKASAGAHLAISHSATEYSETQHLLATVTAPSEVMDLEQVSMASSAVPFAGTMDAETKCGNEFISEIRRGASLLATMKLEFLNKADQFEIGGKLSVNVLNGTVDVSGELSTTDKEKLERTQLTIEIDQLGGDPVKLISILPERIMTCSLAYRQPCVEVFQNLIAYAKDTNQGFLGQLTGPQPHYNVLKYVTQAYEDSNAYDLVPPEYSVIEPAVKQQIQLLERELRGAMGDQLRASNLLNNVSQFLSDAQRSRLTEIYSMASDDIIVYADMSTKCYNKMDNSCLTYVQANKVLLHGAKADGGYDRSELEITTTGPIVSCAGCSVGGVCVPSGATAPGNTCQVCSPTTDAHAYSSTAEGTPCDDGHYCSDASECRGGSCIATVPRACPANTYCDEVFDTCQCINTNWYLDSDGDGYGNPSSSVSACTPPPGYVASAADCCDRDANTHPGQAGYFTTTNACGSWDYDCSGAVSFSMDCSAPQGYPYVSSCGCTTRNTCTASMCGAPQTVESQGSCAGNYGVVTCQSKLVNRPLQCH